MTLRDRWAERARLAPARILLPEGEEPRIVQAATEAARAGVCRPVLMGDPATMRAIAKDCGIGGDALPEIWPIREHELFGAMSEEYAQMRAADGKP